MTLRVFRISHGRRVRTLLATSAVVALLLVTGCGDRNTPKTFKSESVSGEAVQATIALEGAPGVPIGSWPDKVGRFAAAYQGPAWYPSTLPDSFRVMAIDAVEMETGTGLVCDVLLVSAKGDQSIVFTQGSAKARSYDFQATGTTAWGKQTAQVILVDPSDPTSPKMIVLKQGDTLSELSGSVDFETLTEVAASMVPVK